MKNLVIIFLILFALTSCNEEEQMKPHNLRTSDQQIEMKSQGGDEWGLNRSIKIDFPEFGDVWCGAPPIDCWDDVVITASSQQDLINAYDDLDHYYTNDSVVYFFNNCDWDLVFPGLSSYNVNKIKSSDFILTKREDLQDKDTEIYIVLESGTGPEDFEEEDVIEAMPLKVTK